MRAAVIALGVLVGCGPAAGGDGSTLPGGVLDRMTSIEDISAFVHDTAAKAPPPPPPKPRPPRFSLPDSAPRGAPRTIPAASPARGDRRTVTMVHHWSVDEGKTWHDERYVVDERIGEVRGGRAFRVSLDVIEARVTPPPPTGPSEALPRGSYHRTAEPIMIGDSQAPSQLFKVRDDDILPNLEHRELQTLYDLEREEDVVLRLLIAVRQQPLRVGETIDVLPYVWTQHMVVDRIHRAADKGPLARYVITSEGSRRATVDVDSRGRPIRCFMEFYSSTIELTYQYPV